MPLNDSNNTDDFDRSEVVIGDSQDENKKVGVTDKRRLMVETEIRRGTGQTDTYGRLRTVLPIELISYYFSNTDHALRMNTTVAGGGTGTVSLLLNKGSVVLQNSLGSGHKLNFSTKKYIRYTPGQTHKLTMAGRIGDPASGVEKRWGAFTEFNGFFFKQDGTGLSVVVRDGGAGDPVFETPIAQASFNLDKLDGTGPSGLNLDTDNHGIYIIEWDWHGAGAVKFGVKYNEEVVYCHRFVFDFIQTDTSIRSAALPLNVEIRNTSVQTVAPLIYIAAISAYKDGESRINATYSFSASNGTVGRTVGSTAIPILSIRPKLSFNGILTRVSLVGTTLQVLSSNNNIYVQLIINGTLTGANFQSVNAQSNAERDVSATAITGGIIIWEGYIPQGIVAAPTETSSSQEGILGLWELNVNYAGNTPDTLSIVCQSLGNNSSTYASLTWLEYQ